MPRASKKPDDRGRKASAKEVKDATGLSYRQLNEWDARGALPNDRPEEGGWRRFSTKQVFTIVVCKALRDRFGVPLESLEYVRSFMLQEQADHLSAATRLMALGLSVWLLTDLKETFVMDSDLEIEDLVTNGFLRSDQPSGYILLNVNELINGLRKALNLPRLDLDEGVYRDIHLAMQSRTATENEVLEAIRNRDYKSVTLTRPNKEEIQLEVEEELPQSAANGLPELLESEDYQDIQVKRHDGKNVRVSRKKRVRVKGFL